LNTWRCVWDEEVDGFDVALRKRCGANGRQHAPLPQPQKGRRSLPVMYIAILRTTPSTSGFQVHFVMNDADDGMKVM